MQELISKQRKKYFEEQVRIKEMGSILSKSHKGEEVYEVDHMLKGKIRDDHNFMEAEEQ